MNVKLLFLLLLVTPVFALSVTQYIPNFVNNSEFDIEPYPYAFTNETNGFPTKEFSGGKYNCEQSGGGSTGESRICQAYPSSIESAGIASFTSEMTRFYHMTSAMFFNVYNSTAKLASLTVTDINHDAFNFTLASKPTYWCLETNSIGAGGYPDFEFTYLRQAYYQNVTYDLEIYTPISSITESSLSVPLQVLTNRSASYMNYQLSGWGSTWKNLTYVSFEDGSYQWAYEMFYLDSGSYTVIVKDDLGSSLNTSFTVARVATPTSVSITRDNKFLTCSFDKMNLEGDYNNQRYIVELWKDNVNVVKDYIQTIGSVGGGSGAGYTFRDDGEKYVYSSDIMFDSSTDSALYTCRVAQMQYEDNTFTSTSSFSNYGVANINIFTPFVKLYKIDLVNELPSGYNTYNLGVDDSNVTLKINGETDGSTLYTVQHSNTNFNTYYSVSVATNPYYYNVTLQHGQNLIKVFDVFGNVLNWFRLNAYDTTQVNNISVVDEFNSLICDVDTCANNNIYSPAYVNINTSIASREVQVEIFVNESNNLTLVYAHGLNTDQDYDLDNYNLKLNLIKFDSNDESLVRFLEDNSNVLNLEETALVTLLNKDYATSTDKQLNVYLPSNKELLLIAYAGDDKKNITLTYRYSIYLDITRSNLGQALLSGCSLKPTSFLSSTSEVNSLSYLNYYVCKASYYTTIIGTDIVYFFGFVMLILAGLSIKSFVARKRV